LERVLSDEGYYVDTATGGREALSMVKRTSYDLLVTDIKMPQMDGFELMRNVKELDDDMAVVVITGYATMDTAVQALREGADDYVTKPFKLREIKDVVSRALEKTELKIKNAQLLEDLEAANEELKSHRDVLKNQVEEVSENLQQVNLQLRRRVKELETLNEVGRLAASELDMERLLRSCANKVAEKLSVERASVLLIEGDWLVLKACSGFSEGNSIGCRQPVGCGLSGYVASKGEGILVNDARNDGRFDLQRDGKYIKSSCVCVPMVYNQERLGVICAADKCNGGVFGKCDYDLLRTMATQVSPAIENARLYQELEESAVAMVRAFVASLEAKDPYLSGHSKRVTQYAGAIGEVMDLDAEEKSVLERASQLHDIGKIGVPDLILNKPSSLSSDEFAVIQQHPTLGADILKPLDFMKSVRPAIKGHHERPDRAGYPERRAWKDVPLAGKIIGVADAFDAMTSARPYRPPLSPEDARSEIVAFRNKQFDSNVADAFCDVVFQNKIQDVYRHEKAG
jgi:putative nucleotidyltransferase with HDIG domain